MLSVGIQLRTKETAKFSLERKVDIKQINTSTTNSQMIKSSIRKRTGEIIQNYVFQ